MFAYSPKNNNANNPPPNSTLNPETSSDSPSAKSKGARLVSATVLVNHTTIIGTSNIKKGKALLAATSHLEDVNSKDENRRTSNILTS